MIIIIIIIIIYLTGVRTRLPPITEPCPPEGVLLTNVFEFPASAPRPEAVE
jgi:hypothetical protein